MRVLNIVLVITICLGLCGCPSVPPDGPYYPYEPTPGSSHKLQGVKVAFVADYDSMGQHEPNSDVMFATITS